MQASSPLSFPTFEMPEIVSHTIESGEKIYLFKHSFDFHTRVDFMTNTANLLGSESKPLETRRVIMLALTQELTIFLKSNPNYLKETMAKAKVRYIYDEIAKFRAEWQNKLIPPIRASIPYLLN